MSLQNPRIDGVCQESLYEIQGEFQSYLDIRYFCNREHSFVVSISIVDGVRSHTEGFHFYSSC